MEKVLGIIAEYNPFHNGHFYHLKESIKKSNSDYVVSIIGNNFTQRGDVSIIDKWTKTKIALENGVDLVLELPSIYSTSCAENFAYGAISILDSLKIMESEKVQIGLGGSLSATLFKPVSDDDYLCLIMPIQIR